MPMPLRPWLGLPPPPFPPLGHAVIHRPWGFCPRSGRVGTRSFPFGWAGRRARVPAAAAAAIGVAATGPPFLGGSLSVSLRHRRIGETG